MATPEQIRRRGRWSLVLGTLVAALLLSTASFADNVVNTLDTSVDAVKETMNLTVGAGTGTTRVWVQNVNVGGGDTNNACNLAGAASLTVNVASSNTSIATVTPSTVTIDDCSSGNTADPVELAKMRLITVTPVSAGSADITFSQNAFNGSGTFNYAPATFTANVAAPADATPPVITPNVSGTLGVNGWYTSDVIVSWSVVDNESAISSSASCNTTALTADTTGTTLTCTATSAGGTASNSVTIKRDATAPTISGNASPAPNTNGWNNTDVTVSFTCSDATSGIASCPVNQTLSGEGAGQSASGTATDLAGNSASTTVSGINIDKTSPTANATATPAPNANGWNNTDVTVSFSGTDGLSGIDFCSAPAVLSTEGAGQSAGGTCTDKAGNESALATASGISIDKTAPTASASASPGANAHGWNNTDVTVSFSGTDGLSGIDFCSAPAVLSTEGAGQSASGTCTDKAGNVSPLATASGINVDKTAPSVALVDGPAHGGSYYFGFVPAGPTCTASDALSGLDGTCSITGYLNSIGTHTVTASATDKAGNTASASATYTVLAWTLHGFFQPVDMGMSVWNTVKGGSTVPLKFRVFAGPTELTDTAIVTLMKAVQVSCSGGSEDSIEELAPTGGTSLRYDTTGGQFIYNWQTPRQPGKCYRATVQTADGSSLVANFKLK